MQEKLRCAIYTRVSTDSQAEVEFNSCEAQEEFYYSCLRSRKSPFIKASFFFLVQRLI